MIKISNLKNKGFMLAEVIITSSVIAVTLVTLYITLNKVSSLYETNARYNDIDAQQIAMEIDKGICNGNINVTNDLENITIVVSDIKAAFSYSDINVYYMKFDASNFTNIDSLNSNKSFKEYINYLNNNVDFDKDDYSYVIIVEIQKKDVNDCYYYALRVK